MKQLNKNKLGTKTLKRIRKIKDPHMYFYRKKMKHLLKRKKNKHNNLSLDDLDDETDLMEYSKLLRESEISSPYQAKG
jgi:hypothetical protein